MSAPVIRTSRLSSSVLLSALLLPGVALAQDAGPQQAPASAAAKESSALQSDGELRLLGSMYPDIQVDDEGTTTAQGPVLDSRLRVGLTWTPGAFSATTEWDLFDGQLVGDVWDVPGTEDDRDREELGALSWDGVQARKLGIDGRLGKVGVQAGLTTSHWGLGMLANDGNHDPVFGRNDFGDRVIRLRLATRPFNGGKTPLTLVVAGDRVVEDDTAEWSPLVGGQSAWQGILSAVYAKPEVGTYGIYGVFRHQTEQDGERVTQAGVLDLYADKTSAIGSSELRVALEAAGILGHTDRGQTYNAREGVAVQSAGVTGLVALTPDMPVNGMVRAGWSSGDGDSDDDVNHDFAFDRDFDVGMVLFDELLGAVEANTYAQLTDPEHSGGAPEGAEALVTEGAFHGAAFVQPVVGLEPLSWLKLKAGATLAWSTRPVAQAFLTYRNGGVPVNHLGQPTSGYGLGTELDWALTVGDVDVDAKGAVTRPALLLQGGHLLASENLGGGTVTLVTATGRVRW